MDKYYNTLFSGSVLYGNQYNYKIEKVLGQGTFGITYLAKVALQGQLGQLDSNVYVTIKEFFMKEINGREGTNVTSTSSSKGGLFHEYKLKFAREAKNLSKLKHPNIVKVMDYFEANRTCYYVMEYLKGGDLDTLIERRGRLSEEETIRYTKQIGAALSFMHQNKMLHLDLKPKNVVLNANGDAILIDFGLSKQYNSKGEPESSTTVGRGTPGYAPLEQANYQDGHGFPVTMDVYALGATMYKMLTGVRAPEASDILNEGFPKMQFSETICSRNTLDCIVKAMSPMKKNRYGDVEEFLEKLNTEVESGVTIEKDLTEEINPEVVEEPEVLEVQPQVPEKETKPLQEKSVWAFVFSFVLFLFSSYCIEWFLPFYALGGVLFIGCLAIVSSVFKKYAGAFICVGLLLGSLVGKLMNLNFVLYGIVGSGILITLTTIALYNKRNRWIAASLILLGSLFNGYIWYSYNILHGSNANTDTINAEFDSKYERAGQIDNLQEDEDVIDSVACD